MYCSRVLYQFCDCVVGYIPIVCEVPCLLGDIVAQSKGFHIVWYIFVRKLNIHHEPQLTQYHALILYQVILQIPI